ncbi:Glycosyltransferase family 10 (fucosyltransferase) [Piscirickettsiaceae bacterium NZ-RLO1]|nr:Glycosyltransferase family 10 (fucosyltransferase) [Piscirickettsiaceae bacterium NZ-RLO1]
MIVVKIDFDGFWLNFNKYDNIFIHLLRKRFEVVVDEKKPDFIFYSCFQPDYSRDAIKIFYTGENCRVDFNRFDYGIGYDYLSFGDRYMRWPLYRLYGSLFDDVLTKVKDPEQILAVKTGFCTFVYTNAHYADPIRELFFKRLSEYKGVASGGRAFNNVGGPVNDKMAFIRDYKFNIAFENAEAPGYTTEKLVEAMAAETLPIYWGNPCVEKEFNLKSFIQLKSEKDIDKVIEKIVKIDQNDDLYIDMMSEKWVDSEKENHVLESELLDFFENIFKQGPAQAARITKYGFNTDSLDPESIRKELKKRKSKAFKENNIVIKPIRRIVRSLQGKD